jgi:hypothetical protein
MARRVYRGARADRLGQLQGIVLELLGVARASGLGFGTFSRGYTSGANHNHFVRCPNVLGKTTGRNCAKSSAWCGLES